MRGTPLGALSGMLAKKRTLALFPTPTLTLTLTPALTPTLPQSLPIPLPLPLLLPLPLPLLLPLTLPLGMLAKKRINAQRDWGFSSCQV